MYDLILVTLDATPTDRVIIKHVKALAKVMNSRVMLLHVADGWAAAHVWRGCGQPRGHRRQKVSGGGAIGV